MVKLVREINGSLKLSDVTNQDHFCNNIMKETQRLIIKQNLLLHLMILQTNKYYNIFILILNSFTFLRPKGICILESFKIILYDEIP